MLVKSGEAAIKRGAFGLSWANGAGRRERDLILTALCYDRYGWHTKAEYAEFIHRYGFTS
ncbi:hypothetical protein ACFZB2_16950 [Streptomyces bobili]|uniref:hypothetical protein n=1 Tax=Streptomyces bobili TaxID=67280 RepID=UPI0036E34E6A